MSETQTITSSLLHSFGACANQVEIFDARFPHGLDLTRPDSELIPLLDGLDLDWAASHLLTAPAWAAYRAATARAKAAYLTAPALADWRAAREPVWAAREPVWAAYLTAAAPVKAAYQAAIAQALLHRLRLHAGETP